MTISLRIILQNYAKFALGMKNNMRTESITSAQNPKIKDLLALQEKSKERRKKGLFVVEGRRELLHCIEAGYEPHTVFSLASLAASTAASS